MIRYSKRPKDRFAADDVDFLAGGLCGYNLFEKADKLLAGVVAGSASDDLAAAGLEGGIKGEGAVTEYSNPWRSARPG